ncbi:MAG TPA: VWA domain-containing protein [Pyrinomonadaceae bacterium]|nr:VWA domain-containing protein [Pyrinomonadaceae bacterium]
MPLIKPSFRRTFSLTFLALVAFSLPADAQQEGRAQAAGQADDIVRVTTELVQTEIMVFDKHGRFADGLRPEQFELTLAGTKQAVSFFERVRAGSASEAAQLAATRKPSATAPAPAAKADAPEASESLASDRGRVIFFFVDDVHLSGASVARARAALTRFVEREMNPNDRVAIVSASGQIGFLQQLTDNPAVLRAAIARISDKRTPEAYGGKTRISEYMASQIQDYRNLELYTYLMEAVKVEMQAGPGNRHGDHELASSYSAGPHLRNRLYQIETQARMATMGTLDALRGLMLSSAQLPGRKLVFFISDGFIVNERKVGALEALRSVTQTAERSGVVVYTMSLRESSLGLGSSVDASTNDYVDPYSRKAGATFGELAAAQEPLRTIADETGGRAILNPDSLDEGIREAIRETSDYYVLAWRPATTEQREGRLRLKVSIKDRPDLRVRLRNSIYEPAATAGAQVVSKAAGNSKESGNAKETAAAKAQQQASPDAQLLTALGALYPRRALPVSLSVGYMQAAEPILRLSMQTEREALDLDPQPGAKQAFLDVIGAAVDDRGIVVTFKQVVTVAHESTPPGEGSVVVWNQQLNVKPGLYQVRVAVRERASGRTGGAQQWIEVPDASQAVFNLSSIFLGERRGGQGAHAEQAGQKSVTVDVDHKFARTSALRFQTYVYNAGGPVWIHAQVLRNRRPVMTLAPARVPLTADPARLPYWAEIALDKLPAGQYTLQVSATNEAGKATAAQRINFSVE